MKTIINNHNKQILKTLEPVEERKFNCPKTKPNCPLDGQCLIESVVYKASVTPESSAPKQYIGLTTSFKERLGNHNQSFKNKSLSHSTELSKYLWALKERNEKYTLKWSIIQKATPYNPATKRCNLCLAEKYHIMTADKNITLNKRPKLMGKCRHRDIYKLIDFCITWLFSCMAQQDIGLYWSFSHFS